MVVGCPHVPTGLQTVETQIPDTPPATIQRIQAIQVRLESRAGLVSGRAFNHEPGNAGIQRLDELAQFTMEREKPAPICCSSHACPSHPRTGEGRTS